MDIITYGAFILQRLAITFRARCFVCTLSKISLFTHENHLIMTTINDSTRPKEALKSLKSKFQRMRQAGKRVYTDSISWLVFFALTLIFCFLYLWFGFKAGKGNPAFTNFISFFFREEISNPSLIDYAHVLGVIFKDSFLYTLIMAIPVYINLHLIKPNTVDHRPITRAHYVLYLVLVIGNALFFATLIYNIEHFIFRTTIQWPVNLLTITGVQLVATGLLVKRELIVLWRRSHKLEFQIKKKTKELNELQERYKPYLKNIFPASIKNGNRRNYFIIALNRILYLKGAGNEPFIYTNDEKGKYCGNQRLIDYENNLPSYLFLRVHRSYLVAKGKVIGRAGDKLIMQGGQRIPIGALYLPAVEEDEVLKWL